MLYKVKFKQFLATIALLSCMGCTQKIDGFIYTGGCGNENKTTMTSDQYHLIDHKIGNLSFDQKVEFPLYMFGGGSYIEYKESYYSFFKNEQNEVVVQKVNNDDSCECSIISKEEYNEIVSKLGMIDYDDLHIWEY